MAYGNHAFDLRCVPRSFHLHKKGLVTEILEILSPVYFFSYFFFPAGFSGSKAERMLEFVFERTFPQPQKSKDLPLFFPKSCGLETGDE